MNTLDRLTHSLEYWDEELPHRRAALAADPDDRDLAFEVEAAEKMRKRAYAKASDAYDRECEDEYAGQWASWAYGPDVNGGT